MYFNEATLAVCPFPIDLYTTGTYKDLDCFNKAIAEREGEVAENNYFSSILCLPDAMRMEYFNFLVAKKGPEIPGLYSLFSTYYVDSDYGFGHINQSTLDTIFKSKTVEDKKTTEEQLRNLPDVLKVYRGGNSASTPYEKAYSWTLDINVANFFACRRGTGEGYIVEGQVNKKDIIEAYLDERGEQEVLLRPKDVTVLQTTPIKGTGFIKETLPKIAPIYREYLEKLKDIPFAQESKGHGVDHEARVLLNALTIAHCLDLPMRDRRVLAAAAIYHDTQRTNDTEDVQHGKESKEYYQSSIAAPDPLVEFLCEYHCLPDEEGYDKVTHDRKLSKSRSRSKLLFDIFKDADALDRVRFGIRDLDLNQLRLPVSKELTLVARLYYEQVKVPFKTKLLKPSLNVVVKSAASRATTGHEDFVPQKEYTL